MNRTLKPERSTIRYRLVDGSPQPWGEPEFAALNRPRFDPLAGTYGDFSEKSLTETGKRNDDLTCVNCGYVQCACKSGDYDARRSVVRGAYGERILARATVQPSLEEVNDATGDKYARRICGARIGPVAVAVAATPGPEPEPPQHPVGSALWAAEKLRSLPPGSHMAISDDRDPIEWNGSDFMVNMDGGKLNAISPERWTPYSGWWVVPVHQDTAAPSPQSSVQTCRVKHGLLYNL